WSSRPSASRSVALPTPRRPLCIHVGANSRRERCVPTAAVTSRSSERGLCGQPLRAVGRSSRRAAVGSEKHFDQEREDEMRLQSRAAGLVATLLIAIGASSCSDAAAAATEITVYATPTCGCCGAWMEHMRENGFSVD